MWSILLFVLGLNAFGAGCRDHNPNDKSVPECPANGSTLLPDSYPVMAVSVSDHYGKGDFAADFVTKALRGVGDKPPQFFLNVSEDSMKKIRAAVVRAAGNDKRKRERWLASLTKVDGEIYNWQQDFMQGYAGPDGRPVPRELAHYRSRGDHYSNLAQALQSKCGLKSGDPVFPDPNKDIDGYSGGNIEGGPNGLCFFGRDKLSEGEQRAHAAKVCGNGNFVGSPSQDMVVGHTDELTATLRTGPGECDQVMLVASPRAALDVMRADPSGKAFAVLNSRDGERLAMNGSLYDICKKFLEGSPGPAMPSPGVPAAVPERNGWFEFFVLNRAYAGAIGIGGSREEPEQTLARCKDMTNGQFLQAYEQHRDLPALNRIMEERMAQFRREAEEAWKKNAPNCPQRFIEMPTLFEGRTFNKGTEVGRVISLLPDVNNVQQFGKSVLIPDPQSEALRKDIRARLKKAGLNADFINTNAMHSMQGNLHCTTNTLRYCRPRAGSRR